uniref:Splicing factor 3b subunit 4 n=1 Tax=Lotharella vacuolata TaxID=74820 RepID=A0A0H5BJY8_9EUKA|nr:splicing factor 3b subunit 4 [Lotharella vacuolata]
MEYEKSKISNQLKEKNINATLFIGNLDQKINEEILWELFLQIGPIATLILPRDKIDFHHFGYCFIEYESQMDCDYAIKLFNPLKLFNKTITINKLNNNATLFEVGATIFIGNLSKTVNEKVFLYVIKLLYDSFSHFGVITKTPKILNSYISKKTKRFGLITYGSFESSDAAIYAMNGQYFSGRVIYVSYAYLDNSSIVTPKKIQNMATLPKDYFRKI